MALRITHPIDGWGQHKQRGSLFLFDQHKSQTHPDGRPWWTYTEKQVDGGAIPQPVGELQPVGADVPLDDGTVIRGWAAPWYPEAKYMVIAAGLRAGNKFRIDYNRMIQDYREGEEQYYRRAVSEAATLNLPMPMYGELPSWKLRQIVGEPPKSPKIPQAAQAGDLWLLGASKEPNEQLRRLLYTGDNRIASSDELKALQQDADAFSQDEIRAAVSALREAKRQRGGRRPSQATDDAA